MHPAKQTERAQQFAQAAAQLFAHQGYRGTSTREIARVAGVAENTLFRYFESKEKLFWAALEFSLKGWEVRPELVRNLEAQRSPEQVLPLLIAQVVDTTLVRPELLRLLTVAYVEMGAKTIEVCRNTVAPFLGAVCRYLSIQTGQREGARLDPAILTAAIVTTALLSGTLVGLIDPPGGSPTRSKNRDTIDAVSRFWTDVLVPARSAR